MVYLTQRCISKPLMHISNKTVLVSIMFPTCFIVFRPTTIALKFKMYSLQQTLNCLPHKCDDYNRTNLYIKNSLPEFNVMPNNTIGVAKEKSINIIIDLPVKLLWNLSPEAPSCLKQSCITSAKFRT